MNNNLILLTGKSSTGKSASLRNLLDPENVAYMCCENNKALPFASKFKSITIEDPYTVHRSFEELAKLPQIHTVVIDTLTFLMDLVESQVVETAEDGFEGWKLYAGFFKKLMQTYVTTSDKNIIITAHTANTYNESELIAETRVKVKGQLMDRGIESFFTNVISTKIKSITELANYQNDLLTITPKEEILGYKYVFQTQLTKDTINERIRGPLDLWSTEETFIDNDVQLVLNRLHEHYK
jgi:hypothetical protein